MFFPWGFRLTATKRFSLVGTGNTDVELDIELAESPRTLYVMGMNFHDYEDLDEVGRRFLDPQAFLRYHGSQFYSINPEIKNKNCWHIGAVRDFDAFLEGYDRLAVRLGYQPLFD
jgi:hypothetical protein